MIQNENLIKAFTCAAIDQGSKKISKIVNICNIFFYFMVALVCD